MKHWSEYSDPAAIRALVAEIARISTRPARIMEVCGGQTHAIMRHALDTLLPPHVQLLHGPGCPVCVTPASYLDHAIDIAERPDTIVTTFGDLLRVPSASRGDLFAAKAKGADVRMVTSPLQALDFAAKHPDQQIVHLAIGGPLFFVLSFIYGMVLGMVFERSRSVLPCVLCHFIIDIGVIGLPMMMY